MFLCAHVYCTWIEFIMKNISWVTHKNLWGKTIWNKAFNFGDGCSILTCTCHVSFADGMESLRWPGHEPPSWNLGMDSFSPFPNSIYRPAVFWIGEELDISCWVTSNHWNWAGPGLWSEIRQKGGKATNETLSWGNRGKRGVGISSVSCCHFEEFCSNQTERLSLMYGARHRSSPWIIASRLKWHLCY